MKTTTLISAMLLLAGQTGFMAATAQAASAGEQLFLYSFEETRPLTVDVTKELMAHYLADERPDRLEPGVDNTVRFVSSKDPNTTFEHNLLTGDLRFHRNFARYLGDYQPALPTPDEAVKMAQGFLEENKLLPANMAELKLAHIGGLRATTVIRGERAGPIIDKLITLNYARILNGAPVIGPGSKIIVDIGEKGEVISLTRHWRELSPKIAELAPGEVFALSDAKRLSAAQLRKEFGPEAKFETLDVQTAYFDNNGKVLQPVYAFQTKVFLPDQKAQAFEYVSIIPAMRKPPEKLDLNKTLATSLRLIKGGDVPPSEISKRPD